MKRYGLTSLFIALPVFFLVTTAFADSLTLTTYYPAPFGAYSKIRLVPPDTTPDCTTDTEGTMYVDKTSHIPLYCDENANWVYVPGVWKTSSGSAVLTNKNMSVGIGTTGAASSQLQVYNDSADATFSVTRASGSIFGITSQAGVTSLGTTASTALDIRTANSTRIYITGAGETQVQGGLSVVTSSGNSVITLTNGTTTVYIGMQDSDGTVRISSLPDLNSATDFVYNPASGAVTINGPLTVNGRVYLKADDSHLGELNVQWDEATSGYYAVYAP